MTCEEYLIEYLYFKKTNSCGTLISLYDVIKNLKRITKNYKKRKLILKLMGELVQITDAYENVNEVYFITEEQYINQYEVF